LLLDSVWTVKHTLLEERQAHWLLCGSVRAEDGVRTADRRSPKHWSSAEFFIPQTDYSI